MEYTTQREMNRDPSISSGALPKSPRLAITEEEVGDYLAAFPSLDREAIVGTMVAFGPWREEVERKLRGLSAKARVSQQALLSDERLHATLKFIESAPRLRVTVPAMAAAAHLSPFHFARAFTKTVGQSPHRYLTMRRIERAKQLIASGGMSLAAIAHEVGFRTQPHFTGVFAKFAGMTPHRYREAVRTQQI